MKLFYQKVGTQTVVINNEKVKFVNCIAEVDDEFGAEALKLGLPGLCENGKQPAYQTPMEVKLQAAGKEKEDFFAKEVERLTNVNNALKEQLKAAQADAEAWKAEYTKLAESKGEAPAQEPAAPAEPEPTEEEKLRAELELMTKDQITGFAKEAEIDVTPMANMKKQDMINYIIDQSKE